jgi:hypothetical protein
LITSRREFQHDSYNERLRRFGHASYHGDRRVLRFLRMRQHGRRAGRSSAARALRLRWPHDHPLRLRWRSVFLLWRDKHLMHSEAAMKTERIYPLSYKLEPGEFTVEELEAADAGGCDAIIVHSIIFPINGSRSETIYSLDGKTKDELPPMELFKSWLLMAKSMAKDEKLPRAHQQFCQATFESFWELIHFDLGNEVFIERH